MKQANEAIGFIGVGAMGGPMLGRLAEQATGSRVFGFDADPDTMQAACSAAGATPCGSVEEIARKSDVLFSCLPNDDVLKSVYLDDGGVLDAIKTGSVTVDCSTVSPNANRTVHDRLRERDVEHVDASMLGSVRQANEGTISFVVGGSAAALDRIRPLLDILGGMIVHCGDSGAGNTMKLLHQTLVAGHAVAVGEAVALCQQVGADLDTFYNIVTQGTGLAVSRYFEQRVPRMRSGDFSPLFMLRFMAKDARLARGMIGDNTIDKSKLPTLDSFIATLEEAEAAGLGGEDFSATIKIAEGRLCETST